MPYTTTHPVKRAVALAMGALALSTAFSATVSAGNALETGKKTVTIFHTNDLHSHFKPSPHAPFLGGVARLKTLVAQKRREHPQSLLLDGGDWAEGHVYYLAESGDAAIQIMEEIGYDAAVVGNHDWINGPDQLLGSLKRSQNKTQFLGTNLEFDQYARGEELAQKVLPYSIHEVDGLKIAVLGLSTYQFIYDEYFKPVKITEPFLKTRRMARRLKRSGKADLVIVLSHNSLGMNRRILRGAKDVDLIVGAHDHVKLTEPMKVTRRDGSEAWIVEAEKWGFYLGQVDLEVEQDANGKWKSQPKSYQLHPVDRNVRPNLSVAAWVQRLESAIARNGGPKFVGALASASTEFSLRRYNSSAVRWVAEALRAESGADFAIEATPFVSMALPQGILREVDAFNSTPAIYSHATGRSWETQVVEIKGSVLARMLEILLSPRSGAGAKVVSGSGLEVTFRSIVRKEKRVGYANLRPPFSAPKWLGLGRAELEAPGLVVKGLRIAGAPYSPDVTYRMAVSGGMLKVLQTIDRILPGRVIGQRTSTGQESWRLFARWLSKARSLTPQNLPPPVWRHEQKDWAINREHIWFDRGRSTVSIALENQGSAVNANQIQPESATLRFFWNTRSANPGLTPEWKAIPANVGGVFKQKTLVWDGIPLPPKIRRQIRSGMPVEFKVVLRAEGDSVEANNQLRFWLGR